MITKRLLARLSFSLLLLILAQSVFAQKVITGRVTDAKDGSPIVGATVQPKGGTGGTSTGSDGSYRITVGNDVNTLIVSYVGFGTMEIDIAGKSTADAALTSSSGNNLNEVVVIGYGSVRKKDVTGAVASVTAKDFNRGQINSPEQLLQGKVAGLQITNSSGQPGGLTIVKIRGNNSIRSGNNPLYVVDGVPLDGRTPRPGFASNSVGTSPPSDPLTFINPTEIQSVDVLKDASAAAIYGSRGANGVILITTKKATPGQTKIEANASAGFGNVMRKIDVLDAAGYRAALAQFDAPRTDSGANINAFDAISRSAFTQNYSLAMSGGTDNARYRASFFMGDQDGTILKTYLKKYVGNFNGQFKFLDKKLSLDFSATAANVSESIAPISQDAGSNGNLISLALIWNPTLVLKRANGLYNQENPSGQVNPLALSDAYTDITTTTTLLGNVNAAYKFTPWLEYRMLYGINYGLGNRKAQIEGWIKGTGGDAPGKGAAAVLNNTLVSQTITHTLNFNKNLTDNVSLNAIAGYEYWKTNYWGNNQYVYEFNYNLNEKGRVPINYYDNMSAGKQANLAAGSFKDPSVEIQSYFARAVVGFMGKYTLTATFRADGSNKFGKDNRYGYFPSVAAAWNITKEDFMSNLPVFDDLKLRVGYGITGNQEFAADAALDVYRYNSFGSITTLHFGNDKLKWESVKSIDVGLDFTILKGKVYGAIDYFDKRTEDPLFLRVVSQPTGQGGTQYDNLDAEVKNTGVEFSVGADLVQGKNFDWSINANWTFVKNKFIFAQAGSSPLALTGGLHGQGTSGAYSQAIAHNQPVNVYFLPIFKGFDKDGIGIYSATPEYAGDPNPSSFLGISTDLTFFKKLTLNLGAHGSFGNKLYNNTAMSVINISNINGGRNIASGLVSSGESTANPITTSTRYLESGNYIKLHNATLRYTFGNMGALKNFNVYISGNNLFVISDYKGFDPEVNVDKALNGIPSLGVDYIGYPTQRTFLLGLSFSL
jgi:TonB-dependent starch-binding outer membrane protein SusC